MSGYLTRMRQRIDRELGDSPARKYFSAALYSQYDVTLRLAREHARGAMIDLGCGMMPYRPMLVDRVTRYDSFDHERRRPDVTFTGDLQDMRDIPSDRYDSALCLEVLEHIPDPFAATREIARILAPGGVLVASVPHLSRLHELPHDYYRYTLHGLRHVMTQAGLEVVAVHRRAGLLSFLAHQVSNGVLSATWGIPVLKQLMWFANKWLLTRLPYALDRRIDREGLFALGYTVVARKP
jgi:SAM-dependent methyltransferase